MSKSRQEIREKGRIDGEKGDYDPPHGGTIRSSVLGKKWTKKEKDDRVAYKANYEEGKKNR